ncbi:MAG: aldo/keto reductase [Planctomycetes bacterium]|nr:aldo/keto reductase [Planctomycetota bacterium]
MSTSRRSFLGGAAVGALGLPLAPLGARTFGGQDGAGLAIEAVGRKRIPKTGELLPMIGLGTSRTLDVDPTGENAELLQVLSGFLAHGGTLIDSSPMYGKAEAAVGELLGRLGRSDVFYATKVWTDQGKEAGIRQMEESQQLMGTPRFDLMQVHNLVGLEVQLATLRSWKEEGRIRYLGVTEMRDYPKVEELIRDDLLDFIQIPYSLGERTVEQRVLPAALDHGVAVLVMRPFERGRLFTAMKGEELPGWAADFGIASWAQFFLKFLVGHPAVTCPIPATSKPHHLADNMRGGVGPLPGEAARKKMIALLEG